MSGRHVRWVVPVLVGLLMTACTALDQDARINFLEGQMKDVLSNSAESGVTAKDLRTKLADTSAQMDSIRDQLQKLSGRVDDMESGALPKENSIFNQQGVQEEIRALKERTQALEAKVRDLERQLATSPQTAPDLSASPEQPAVLPPPGAETAPSIAIPPTGQKGAVQGTSSVPQAQREYNEAMGLLKAEKYELAIRRFREFIKKHPDNELSDNAQYWIGESYYAQKKYDEAIIEFEEVIQQYPKGDKVAAALLKEGLAFHELKDNDTAEQILKKVVDKYPSSEEAKIAQEKIASFR
jgi:tol-pal system protein YbgF